MRPDLRVTHLITGLQVGGAEMMLYRLLRSARNEPVRQRVVSLTGAGPVGAMIAALGVQVDALELDSQGVTRSALGALRRHLRRQQGAGAEVIHSWMYHANAATVLAPLGHHPPIIWAIHTGVMNHTEKARTRLIAHLSAPLSRILPRRVVYCSQPSLAVHVGMGYSRHNAVVIQNGVDAAEFNFDLEVRQRVRGELGLADDEVAIGRFARFHPQKDYPTLIAAGGLLLARRPGARLILAGEGMSRSNPELMQLLEAAGLAGKVTLLGPRPDIRELLCAMDIAVSASSGEAFPLAVAEAMAVGLPQVVTDVGDSAPMVGDCGSVVPSHDPAALADALTQMIDAGEQGRRTLGDRARRRVTERFPITGTMSSYLELYDRVAR